MLAERLGDRERRNRTNHRPVALWKPGYRLREGEASILGGIKESQEQVSWTGYLPG